MFKDISIKWRLSLSFIALSLGLVSLYIIIAKKTFESDKIVSIFESEQVQLEVLGHDLNEQFSRALFDGRAILASFDFSQQKLSPLGTHFFNDQKNLIAIEIYDFKSLKTLAKIEKRPIKIASLDAAVKKLFSTSDPRLAPYFNVEQIGPKQYSLTTAQDTKRGDIFVLRLVVEFEYLLPKKAAGHLILSKDAEIFEESNNTQMNQADVSKALSFSNRNRSKITSIHKIGSDEYFVSSMRLQNDDLLLTSIVSKATALKTLNALYARSIAFLIFAGLSTALISVLASLKLTEQLQHLTDHAQRIGRGDFSKMESLDSKDEVGILSRAFSTMSFEISRLIDETRNLARMEQELNTARIVQENLFPMPTSIRAEPIEVSGRFATSSECSGDWWYYFERGDDLFVVIADATGHGTPAALLTSASRAVFSQVEQSDSSLEEIASQWDRAIRSCSNQSLNMSALLLQISKKNGLVRCLNASHPPPFFIRQDNGLCEFLMLPLCGHIGNNQSAVWQTHSFTLSPNEVLLLYTDGLTEIENKAGRALSERKLIKELPRLSADNTEGASGLSQKIHDLFDRHRDGAPLTDDITLVVIQRLPA